MHFRPFIRFLLAGIFMLVPLTPLLAADWSEVKSENFILYSKADPEFAEGLVEDLEVFRAYLIKLTNVDQSYLDARKEAGVETAYVIYGLKNYSSFESLTGRIGFSTSVTHARGIVTFVDLSHQPDPFEGKRGKRGREPLFYEYAKYFIQQYSNFNYPIWYSQGLAIYLSTFEMEDGIAKVGLPPLRTVRLLASAFSHHLIPIDYMLGSTREYSRGITGLGNHVEWKSLEQASNTLAQGDVFTAEHNHSGILNPETLIRLFKFQSWGIVHYMQSDPVRRKNMIAYLIRLNVGENYKTAFEDVFGQSMKSFSNEVSAYTERNLYPSLQIEFPIQQERGTVNYKPLSEAEGRFLQIAAKAYFLDQKKRLFAIKNQLEDAPGPFRNEARTILAEMEFYTGNFEKAEKIIRSALDNSSDLPRANGVLGAILIKKGEINEARDYLRRAIRQDTNDVLALYYLGHSYVLDPTENLNEGVMVMGRANSIFPQNETIELELAILDNLYGSNDVALPALENLAGWGSREAIRVAAENCLGSIQNGGTCTYSEIDGD